MEYFTTGEVAKRLNMSVRTLRYYDQINLAVPSLKDENGKRFYSESDLLLLQKISLLKETSMSLKDIEQIINDLSIGKVLTVHKMQLETDKKALEQSLLHTQTLLNVLKIEGSLHWIQLLPLLTKNKQQKLEQKQLLLNQLFNEEEQVQLIKSLPKMEDSQGNITKWINIIKRIELCIEEEQMPHSRHGQLIAEDILLLSEETFGANQALVDSFWQIRKDEEQSATMQLYPVKKEIIQFIEECITYYENNHHRTSITNQDEDY